MLVGLVVSFIVVVVFVFMFFVVVPWWIWQQQQQLLLLLLQKEDSTMGHSELAPCVLVALVAKPQPPAPWCISVRHNEEHMHTILSN